MSRTVLLEQIVALELGSEVRGRLERLASYRAADGFSIDFGFYDYPCASGESPLEFAISVNVKTGSGPSMSFETFESFKFDEVPLITAQVALRGDMEVYYRDMENERLEYLRKLRAILVEPYVSPIERHLLETAQFNNDDLINLELEQMDLEDWPHEPTEETD